jgi:hypothetical protein
MVSPSRKRRVTLTGRGSGNGKGRQSVWFSKDQLDTHALHDLNTLKQPDMAHTPAVGRCTKPPKKGRALLPIHHDDVLASRLALSHDIGSDSQRPVGNIFICSICGNPHPTWGLWSCRRIDRLLAAKKKSRLPLRWRSSLSQRGRFGNIPDVRADALLQILAPPHVAQRWEPQSACLKRQVTGSWKMAVGSAIRSRARSGLSGRNSEATLSPRKPALLSP